MNRPIVIFSSTAGRQWGYSLWYADTGFLNSGPYFSRGYTVERACVVIPEPKETHTDEVLRKLHLCNAVEWVWRESITRAAE